MHRVAGTQGAFLRAFAPQQEAAGPVQAYEAAHPALGGQLRPTLGPLHPVRPPRAHSATVQSVLGDRFGDEPYRAFTSECLTAYLDSLSLKEAPSVAGLYPALLSVMARCRGPEHLREDYTLQMAPRSDRGALDMLWRALGDLPVPVLQWLWPSIEEFQDFYATVARHIKALRVTEGLDMDDTVATIQREYLTDLATAATWLSEYGKYLLAVDDMDEDVARAEQLAMAGAVNQQANKFKDGRLALGAQRHAASLRGLLKDRKEHEAGTEDELLEALTRIERQQQRQLPTTDPTDDPD